MDITRRELGAIGVAALAGPTVAAPPTPGWRHPPALKVGDMVAFVAPAGPVDRAVVLAAQARVEKLGFRVRLPAGLLTRRDRYLAGSDAERADEFNAAVRDKAVRAVMPVRGGYGLTRILDRLDYAALSADPKIITGFSDLTALHLAIARRCRLVTFHSPVPQFGLARRGGGFDYSNDLFWRTVQGQQLGDPAGLGVPLPAGEPKPVALVGGVARGRLVGGNLSLIAATVGTPYGVEPDGNLLFLEDTGEAAYRIDRMLSQLRLAGLLGRFTGVILGTFDGTDPAELAAVIRDYFGASRVPVLTGFPVGHTPFNATLAHGALAELDATAGRLRYLQAPLSK